MYPAEKTKVFSGKQLHKGSDCLCPRVPDTGGTVIGGTALRTASGGKGANQVVQCARLGASVTMVGCVGTDAFGKEMTETAKASGVDVSPVKLCGKRSSSVGNIQLEVTGKGVQTAFWWFPVPITT